MHNSLTGVDASDLDKALDRVSGYYHQYVDKGGKSVLEAYAKVLERFPDAIFACYTFPKVLHCVSFAVALYIA